MSDSESSPLLSADDNAPRQDLETGTEATPLLLNSTDDTHYDGAEQEQQRGNDGASVRSYHSDGSASKAPRRRWASITAMIILGLLTIGIMFGAFFVPKAVEEYAKEAAVLEPTNLSLESITANGVRARIQANFKLDGSRVENEHVRRVGRVATWFVRGLGTDATQVHVFLPEYDNVRLGSAAIPPLDLKINGDNTAIDFVAVLMPGEADGIRTIANEWLEGRLGRLRVQGKADITLKTGIIPLGTHAISEALTIEGQSLYQSFASLYFGEKTLF